MVIIGSTPFCGSKSVWSFWLFVKLLNKRSWFLFINGNENDGMITLTLATSLLIWFELKNWMNLIFERANKIYLNFFNFSKTYHHPLPDPLQHHSVRSSKHKKSIHQNPKLKQKKQQKRNRSQIKTPVSAAILQLKEVLPLVEL